MRSSVVCALLLGVSIARSQETASGVSFDVFPKAAEFPLDGAPLYLTAVLRNGSTNTLHQAHLAQGPSLGVTLDAGKHLPVDLPAGEATTWPLRVDRPADGPILGTVPVVLQYDVQEKNGSKTRNVSTAEITLTRPEIETIESPVSVKVDSDFDQLNSSDDGSFHVTLTNKCATTVTSSVEVKWPESHSILPNKPGPYRVVLGPRSSDVISIPVKADQRVKVGKQAVDFVVTTSWGTAKQQERKAVETRSVTLGVFAESAILQLVGGVPLLLLLPGFLVIQSWGILWRNSLLRSRYDTQAFPFTSSTGDFALVAILVSLLLFLLNNYLLGFDYVRTYGFQDLVSLYIASVFIGAGSYLLIMGSRFVIKQRQIPKASDTEIQCLERLGASGLALARPTFERGTANAKTVFLLEPPAEEADRAKTWIAPPIEFKWSVGSSDSLRRELGTKLTAELNRQELSNSTQVAALIRKAVEAHIATINWTTSGGISGPAEVDTKDLRPLGRPALIVLEMEG